MKINDGDIIPEVRIGNIRLNSKKEKHLNLLKGEFKERFREDESIIEIKNAEFWIGGDEKIDQIGVWGNFKGKYKGITRLDLHEKMYSN